MKIALKVALTKIVAPEEASGVTTVAPPEVSGARARMDEDFGCEIPWEGPMIVYKSGTCVSSTCDGNCGASHCIGGEGGGKVSLNFRIETCDFFF